MNEPYIRIRSSGRFQARKPSQLWTEGSRALGTRDTIEEARALRDEFLAQKGYKLVDGRLVEIGELADDSEHIKKEQATNTMTVESVGRIVSVDQLLELAGVDLDVWRVERQKLNKWEVGAKAEHKNLTYDDGKVSGTIRSDGIEIEQLIQVTAWLVRNEPIALFPTIQPITCEERPSTEIRSSSSGIRRAVVFADPHIGFSKDTRNAKLEPFHDRDALDLVCQVVEYADADAVWCVGDFLDMTEWTDRFARLPEFADTTQPALCEGHWWLRQFSGRHVGMLVGNHGDRMRRHTLAHLRAAYDLRPVDEMDLPPVLSMERLLALDGLGVEYIPSYPDGEAWLCDDLRLIHGARAQVPGSTARTVSADADACTVFGHIHRQEMVTRQKKTRNGQQSISGICPGCTCRIYYSVPGHSRTQDWSQGFVVIDYSDDGFEPSFVRIKNGTCIYDRVKFGARDRVRDIAQSFPDWNW